MSEPDEIGERVTRLEHQMSDARKDAAAARILAGGADRDVSDVRTELRAHTTTLNALRETQREHGERLGRLERKVDDGFARVDNEFASVRSEMREGFTRVDNQFAEMREGFTKVGLGMAQITALLTTALNKPDDT